MPDGKTASQAISLREVGDIELRVPPDATVKLLPSGEIVVRKVVASMILYTTMTDLNLGSYTLEASGPGYETVSATVLVTRGGAARFEPWTTGSLLVETDPPGGEVRVEGKTAGTSPLRLDGLKPGQVRLALPESAEYLGLEQSPSVELGRTTSVSYVLKPKPATLTVLAPLGAPVVLLGALGFSKSGIAGPSGGISFADLPATDYLLKAGGAEGFESYEAMIDLGRGEKKSVRPWTTGSLHITTNPSGARIFLGTDITKDPSGIGVKRKSKDIGCSPSDIERLVPEKAEIHIIMKGYRDIVASLEVVPGKKLERGFTLEPFDHREMIYIPAGNIVRKISRDIGGGKRVSEEFVTPISSYNISKNKVTQDLYQTVTKVNPVRVDDTFKMSPNQPVSHVSWYDALVFCNLLSMQEGRKPCYYVNWFNRDPSKWSLTTDSKKPDNSVKCDWSADGYRLPTFSETSYASEDLHCIGVNYDGLLHEWCWDWYSSDSYLYASLPKNPKGPNKGDNRVIAYINFFGSWLNCSIDPRDPCARDRYTGFRIVTSSHPSKP